MGFWGGTPATVENVSTLRSNQEPLHAQSVRAAQKAGAGGAFGDVADYYRNNLSNNPADFQAFAAPEMRRFNEQIVPDLAEQFAGMGSGGLSSSGFRNAAVGAGTDLSERLGAIRANLRQQSAQGLMQSGQQGLQSYTNQIQTPGTEGFGSTALSGILGAAGTAIGGPILGAATTGLANTLTNSFNAPKVAKNTSPYGNANAANAAMAGR